MTLWQLKAFTTVAKEGSFTKAGKILEISQPSVSALVIGLQKELNVRLFEKLGQGPILPKRGDGCLSSCTALWPRSRRSRKSWIK
jgi:DNA-binding transcriptional LysR family regulator